MSNRIRLTLASALLGAALGADAALLAGEPQWEQLLEQGRTAELGRAARERLAARPRDWNAAMALGLTAALDGELPALAAAVPPLQRCLDQRPERAGCHYVMGLVQAVQTMNRAGGHVFSSPSLVRDRFTRALALDPTLFEARSSLVDFYLLAPSLAGGSGKKARELADAIRRKEPERARLLRIKIALNDQDLEQAERELSKAAKPGGDGPLRDGLLAAWMELGLQFQGDGETARARAAFEAIQRDFPEQAAGHYGLGCLLLEQGQTEDAIRQLERARGLGGAWRLPVELRLGQAWQAKGERRLARQAVERFLAGKRGNPRDLREARERLMALGPQ